MTFLNWVGAAMIVVPLVAIGIAFAKGMPEGMRHKLAQVAGAIAYWALAVFLVLL